MGVSLHSPSNIRSSPYRPSGDQHWLAAAAIVLILCSSLMAAGLVVQAEAAYRTGQYEQAIDLAQKAMDQGRSGVRTWRVLTNAAMAMGRYQQAANYIERALQDYPDSILLWLLAAEVLPYVGQSQRATSSLDLAYRLASRRALERMSAEDLVATGQVLLQLGGEPRIILDQFYLPAIQRDPNCPDPYIAAGTLAIDKQDYQLAARYIREAIARIPEEPDCYLILARAFYPNDRRSMLDAINKAVKINPRHVASLLLLAEHMIDCEDYPSTEKVLQHALEVNPWHPEALALKALLAHLTNDPNQAAQFRAKALHWWQDNPRVDHLIGKKLSQKYRFSEGLNMQLKALQMDPMYMPARLQAAQDLLRLGSEEEGWDMVEAVHKHDPYNVTAYNLVCLRDRIKTFEVLQADGLTVRMDPTHARLYGQQVIDLLRQARTALADAYGYRPGHITVEIFPNPQDFAVRTFGMPGAEGFLAVCFGNLITARAPGPSPPHNWHAILWHEYTHAVTLEVTKNKMPRWLSEGISVYEQGRHNPSWSYKMDPQYRQLIQKERLPGLSGLSEAFLDPRSPVHLQFAYYLAGLAVEFIIEHVGMTGMRAILEDLATGQPIEDVLTRRVGRLEVLDQQFLAFATDRFQQQGLHADWEQPTGGDLDPTDANAIGQFLAARPNNIWALKALARVQIGQGQLQQAIDTLQRLIRLCPEDTGQDNAYVLLAKIYQQVGQLDKEWAVLEGLAQLSADAGDAFLRLVEMAYARQDWDALIRYGQGYIAVDPLNGQVYQRLGQAFQATAQYRRAIEAYTKALLLDPEDPGYIHYRLAGLLRPVEPTEARRHILEALAFAPRFRQGYRLLLDIVADLQQNVQGGSSDGGVTSDQQRP
ncbi:MAG: tetratricopeptide repeat protein [Sedimentisphaerales bacterium]|nr:tetratricopeptide repeat protein [Sedimentisphaerales bacterium]